MNDAKTPAHALLHLYCILRCNRWGTFVRWASRTLATNPTPQPMESWWCAIVLDGNIEQVGIESVRDICSVNVPEARETGRCVGALPEHLRLTMLQEHVIRGKQQQKANALKIDRTTYWRRCERSYALLLGMFNDVAAGLPAEVPGDEDEAALR